MSIDMNDRNFFVGQKVYRARWDKVEEGVVIGSQKVSFTPEGTSYPDKDGEYTEFIAQFNQYQFEGQTYAWKYFSSEQQAYAKLASEIIDKIVDLEKAIIKWKDLLQTATEASKLNEEVENK